MQTPLSNPLPTLAGKVAIVTGASRGIGEAIARTYAAAGAKVVLASRKLDGLEAAAARIREAGHEATAITCHAGREEQLDALVGAAVDRYGKVDVLVNNAATNPYFGPMMGVDWGAWDKTFEVNTKGYFMAIRAVVRHLTAREAPGSIVNVASIAGMTAAVAQGVYGMSKAAVISMTQTLAVELGGSGIRINAIAPGLVQTHFAGALLANEGLVRTMTDRAPVRRVGVPDDIAGLALYLGSDASGYMTGQTLVVDGGMMVSAAF
ncbi:MAG: glucose 1-dehydrogenase [Deltaproteobacteria bacterium]|nr:glucose 1-dehydrogenase [Deltaproteobacteria bacterium]